MDLKMKWQKVESMLNRFVALERMESLLNFFAFVEVDKVKKKYIFKKQLYLK